jgi:hypothetical protein
MASPMSSGGVWGGGGGQIVPKIFSAKYEDYWTAVEEVVGNIYSRRSTLENTENEIAFVSSLASCYSLPAHGVPVFQIILRESAETAQVLTAHHEVCRRIATAQAQHALVAAAHASHAQFAIADN